jgi:hypothetical protein
LVVNLKIKVERENDGRWIASVPELPGCISCGTTRGDALAKMKTPATRILDGPPNATLDLEEDSSELEAELLKAANGPFTLWCPEELREIADRALREHLAKKQK